MSERWTTKGTDEVLPRRSPSWRCRASRSRSLVTDGEQLKKAAFRRALRRLLDSCFFFFSFISRDSHLRVLLPNLQAVYMEILRFRKERLGRRLFQEIVDVVARMHSSPGRRVCRNVQTECCGLQFLRSWPRVTRRCTYWRIPPSHPASVVVAFMRVRSIPVEFFGGFVWLVHVSAELSHLRLWPRQTLAPTA